MATEATRAQWLAPKGRSTVMEYFEDANYESHSILPQDYISLSHPLGE